MTATNPDAGFCFVCGKQMKIARKAEAWTNDPQMQWVGTDCWRKIVCSENDGYQPSKGGPRLFKSRIIAEEWIKRNEQP